MSPLPILYNITLKEIQCNLTGPNKLRALSSEHYTNSILLYLLLQENVYIWLLRTRHTVPTGCRGG
jgi:hypothetical protein